MISSSPQSALVPQSRPAVSSPEFGKYLVAFLLDCTSETAARLVVAVTGARLVRVVFFVLVLVLHAR